MFRSTLAAALFLACSFPSARGQTPGAISDPGILPKAADGRMLNLDFETGTLQDWTAQGDAFWTAPEGDTVFQAAAT